MVKDFSATSLIGPLASAGQITNAALVGCLYHLATSLEGAASDFPASAIEVLRAPVAVSLARQRCPRRSRLTLARCRPPRNATSA